MNAPTDVVILGLGQLGQLFGAAALKAGHRVTPLLRDGPRQLALNDVSPKAPLWVTVGETDLAPATASLPPDRRDHAILVQNELFPHVWQNAGLHTPTVAVVWISKKKGRPVEIGGATQVFGPHADHVAEVHRALELPVNILATETALGQALVDKYAFILTINALGLVDNKSLGDWLAADLERVHALTGEAALLGAALLGQAVDMEKTKQAVASGMNALAHYPARGRTAALRVERACNEAEKRGLSLPALKELSDQGAAED